jgi:hypothetical protein
MTDDLRETMIHAAAAKYGQEHYRGLLFLHGLRRVWPVLLVFAVVAVLFFAARPIARGMTGHPDLPLIAVGAVVVVAVAWLLIRRARSPYRRRRFR